MHFKGNGSYWSSHVNTERWFSLGPHWNITLLGCAPGCTGAAMGPGTMSWLAEFDFPSCDLLSNRGLHCYLHLHVGWLRHSGGMVRFFSVNAARCSLNQDRVFFLRSLSGIFSLRATAKLMAFSIAYKPSHYDFHFQTWGDHPTIPTTREPSFTASPDSLGYRPFMVVT